METTTGVREIEKLVTAHKQREGGGFIVRRPFPGLGMMAVDPFLLLDEMGPVDYAPGEAVGAPDHPHRGFETVTYVLEGEMEHEDSAGHRGSLRAGDVQWMTAGAGIIHSEMPSRALREHGGRVHGFQVWVNLPASLKDDDAALPGDLGRRRFRRRRRRTGARVSASSRAKRWARARSSTHTRRSSTRTGRLRRAAT